MRIHIARDKGRNNGHGRSTARDAESGERAKARRKLQKAVKDSGQTTTAPNEALHRDSPDRLLFVGAQILGS